jgi:Gpi18-like mannosyltransferase
LFRLILFPYSRDIGDLYYYEKWFNAAADYGLRVFYKVDWSQYGVAFCDYPPFNVYFFWIFGSAAKALSLYGTPNAVYMVKLLPTILDIATIVLIFAFLRKRFNFRVSFASAAVYAFNPAVILDTAVWGQFDSVYTFFLLVSLILLIAKKPASSTALLILGVLTKPQGIALAPLTIYLILKNHGLRGFIASAATAITTLFVVILPFEWSSPITFLWNIYFGAYKYYSVTTANAFNIWAFGGLWRPETQAFLFAGWLMFGALTVFTLYLMHKALNTYGEVLILYSAFMLFFGFFMLPTRIHERYMFPALSVLVLMLPMYKKAKMLYLILTATCFINEAYVLYYLNTLKPIPFEIAWTVSLINLLMLMYTLNLMYKNFRKRNA